PAIAQATGGWPPDKPAAPAPKALPATSRRHQPGTVRPAAHRPAPGSARHKLLPRPGPAPGPRGQTVTPGPPRWSAPPATAHRQAPAACRPSGRPAVRLPPGRAETRATRAAEDLPEE